MDQFQLHLGPLERVHQRNGNVDTCRIKTNNSVATSHTFQRRNRNKTIDACMKLAQNVKILIPPLLDSCHLEMI